MNSLGNFYRVQVFGESHGPYVGLTIDGCTAGIELSAEHFIPDIERRRGGDSERYNAP